MVDAGGAGKVGASDAESSVRAGGLAAGSESQGVVTVRPSSRGERLTEGEGTRRRVKES